MIGQFSDQIMFPTSCFKNLKTALKKQTLRFSRKVHLGNTKISNLQRGGETKF